MTLRNRLGGGWESSCTVGSLRAEFLHALGFSADGCDGPRRPSPPSSSFPCRRNTVKCLLLRVVRRGAAFPLVCVSAGSKGPSTLVRRNLRSPRVRGERRMHIIHLRGVRSTMTALFLWAPHKSEPSASWTFFRAHSQPLGGGGALWVWLRLGGQLPRAPCARGSGFPSAPQVMSV